MPEIVFAICCQRFSLPGELTFLELIAGMKSHKLLEANLIEGSGLSLFFLSYPYGSFVYMFIGTSLD